MAIEAAAHAGMREALVILGSAAIVIPVFHRLRVSPVLGFMLVGILAGPAGLGAFVDQAPWLTWFTITDRAAIAPVAELGVVLLLFMIGLELSFERILVIRRLVFGLGLLQVVGSTVGIALVARLFGASNTEAIVLGLALAMSSTAVVAQVLAEERRVTGRVGRASFAVLLFQDLAVVPIMFALGVLGDPDTMGASQLLLAVGQALGMIVALVLLGRLVLRPLFRGVARTKSPELFMAACLLVVLATGLAAASAGLSMALGALIAGLLLAETEYRRQVEVTVEPFKGLLLGVFLVSVGLNLDLSRLLAQPGAVLGAALALLLGKTVLVAGLGRLFRLQLPVAVPAGLLLAAGGEFGFVILGLAEELHLVPPEMGGFAYLVGALTMAGIPLLSRLGTALFPTPAPAIDPSLLPPEDGIEAAGESPRVIIAGYGRVGRTVAALLEVHRVPYLVLDSDARLVARGRRAGKPVFYGDATQVELLRLIGIGGARAMVVTVDDRARADLVVRTARAENPALLLIVRARDAEHAAQLYALGASDAVPETIEASLQLGEAVLVDIGIPMGPVLVSIHEQRAAFQAEIKARVPGVAVRPLGQVRLSDTARVKSLAP
ncbi:MAG: cation:proton antiporter [Janthinobacterium lividum]